MPAGNMGHPLSGPGTAPGVHPGALEVMRQIRRWTLPDPQPVEAVLTSAPLLIGVPPVGTVALTTGNWGGYSIDWPCRITRCKIRPWDLTAGSIVFDIQKAADGSSDFQSIVGGTPPTISGSADPYIDDALVGWNTLINRHDDLLFLVSSVTSFTLVTISLRLRRLDLTTPA